MNVVHVIDSGGFYGAEVMLMHLCQAQQADGIKVSVISIGTPNIGEKPIEKIFKEKSIPIIAYRMPALPDIRHGYKIIKVARNLGADIIHSHGYKGNILLGLIPKKWRLTPIVSTVHGYTPQKPLSKMAIYQQIDRWVLTRLDGIAIVSEGMRHQVNNHRLGNKLAVIANGIPELPDLLLAPQKTLSATSGSFNILAIGRLSIEKNFHFLISSMPNIIKNIPNTTLTIYGEGNQRTKLEEQIKSLGLSKNVKLPGYLANPETAYINASVFVNCSITEGMPITLLEAMRSGCPIAASNIEANKALLSIKFPNLLFNFNDKELLNAISESQKTNREDLIHCFKNSYSSSIMSKKYSNFYKVVIGNFYEH